MDGVSSLRISAPSSTSALIALGTGAFGIGLTEFVIMGILPEVAAATKVSIPLAGLLISGYALGVTFGGPLLTLLTSRMSQRRVLVALMVIFTIGNLICAIAPNFAVLLIGRIVTGFAHGTFFGVGALVAQSLVPPERKASAIALMFTGLTLATVLGLPFGTWLGQNFGWRATFWAVAAIGVVAIIALSSALPEGSQTSERLGWKDLREVTRRGPALALLMTVLGYAGVFLVFTFIAPILTDYTGFAASMVSPLLMLFGLGLVAGNLLGGRLADHLPKASIAFTLLVLATVSLLMWPGMAHRGVAVAMMFLFGAAAFATAAPLQSFMLRQVQGAGQSLASTLNISAFNLGNALGAWIGGLALSLNWGLQSLFILAAIPPALAGLIALKTVRT